MINTNVIIEIKRKKTKIMKMAKANKPANCSWQLTYHPRMLRDISPSPNRIFNRLSVPNDKQTNNCTQAKR